MQRKKAEENTFILRADLIITFYKNMPNNSLWLVLALANGYFAFIGQKKYTLARILSLIACILSIMMFYFR